MTRIGMSAPRSRTKSNPPLPTNGSSARAQNSRMRLSSAATRRGVNTRLIRPRCRSWMGGSSKMNMPRGSRQVGADQFEHRSLAGDEGLPVARAGFDVLEAADRKEVEPFVAVQRHLVAHPLPDRVRIVVDLEVVRVVVDLFRPTSHFALSRHRRRSSHHLQSNRRVGEYASRSQRVNLQDSRQCLSLIRSAGMTAFQRGGAESAESRRGRSDGRTPTSGAAIPDSRGKLPAFVHRHLLRAFASSAPSR